MLVRDPTGCLRAIWFNQPFLNDVFHPHQRVILFGKLELTSHGLQMQEPAVPRSSKGPTTAKERRTVDEPRRSARRTATRHHTGGSSRSTRRPGQLTAKMQRALVHQALQAMPAELPDPLPADVRQRQQLIDRRAALEQAHFPAGRTLDRAS